MKTLFIEESRRTSRGYLPFPPNSVDMLHHKFPRERVGRMESHGLVFSARLIQYPILATKIIVFWNRNEDTGMVISVLKRLSAEYRSRRGRSTLNGTWTSVEQS